MDDYLYMKNLCEYINESLLDDIDVITNDIEKRVTDEINSFIYNYLGLDNSFNKYLQRGEAEPFFIDGDTLHVNYKQVEVSNPKGPFKYPGFEVDCLDVARNFSYSNFKGDRALDSKQFVKTIKAASISIIADNIKNINLEIDKPSTWDPTVMVFSGVKNISNVEVFFPSNQFKTIYIISEKIPEIKNLKTDADSIVIRQNVLLGGADINKKLNDYWLDKNYMHGGVYINTFRKLLTTIRAEKKYGKLRRIPIKDGAKASDVIPWINDNDSVKRLEIHNNYISLSLYKTDNGEFIDGWGIQIKPTKRK